MHLPKHSMGFTIIEMLMVVAISAILLGIAIPNFSQVIEKNTMVSHINDLVSTLNYAKNEAISRGTVVTVCRTVNDTATTPTCNGSSYTTGGKVFTSSDWSTGWIVFVDNKATGTFGQKDNGELLLKRYPSLNPSGTNKYAFFNANTLQSISYNATGQLASNTGGIRFGLSAGNNVSDDKSICVARGGRIRVVSGTGDNICD